ncbi:MAG: MerR family transcriptional regulator [Defluviitaleaceae bacterium]|nr:MerR family transcriptional regulator [Defluviitaleaceae bacterium]
MKNIRAIPPGHMTVGQIAKTMGVTVRTLQYYDKEGVLSPSAVSEGGRRLYTHKDMVKLHQIQSMKYLGFSLEDIKTRLPSINTPREVSEALTEQAESIRDKIESLQNVLSSIEKLNREVVQMDSVDWEKYANIIVLLQMKNNAYWVIKYFDNEVIGQFQKHMDEDKGDKLQEQYKKIIKKAGYLQRSGLPLDGEEIQALAKEWWDFTLAFTGDNADLLSGMMNMGLELESEEWKEHFRFDKDFIGRALTIYFNNTGHNPFEGAEQA